MSRQNTARLQLQQWMLGQGRRAFSFQETCWEAVAQGKSGLLNAPTGTGKTYALAPAFMMRDPNPSPGLRLLWITPLRALASDIRQALHDASDQLQCGWSVDLRNGDTTPAQRSNQQKRPPHALVTTPESLHLLLASAQHPTFFKHLDGVVVDEWHELLGTKRGTQMELAIARLRSLRPDILVWGISATIENLEQAQKVLLGAQNEQACTVRYTGALPPDIRTVYPLSVDRLPWAGHLGLQLVHEVARIILEHQSTLVFTNTRAQAEIWYRELLEAEPQLAGVMAMHHGSIDRELRNWVEQALHQGTLKAVVATSSLDLGVDFRPVDNIIQIGSPKGIARFLQRAGRSGHRPGAQSRIWFVPTHALELLEMSATRDAIACNHIEARHPIMQPMDVLVQYAMTRAVGGGFEPEELRTEVQSTHAYANLGNDDWEWLFRFLQYGGEALKAYPDFVKVKRDEAGKWKVQNTRTAMRHRMQIGTIVSDPMLRIKFQSGGTIGTVEESFVSKLKPGDVFWFGGRCLEFVRLRELEVHVKLAKAKKAVVPQWMGGRMPLSAQLSDHLRGELGKVRNQSERSEELHHLEPLFQLQSARSYLPGPGELLIETFESREGFHVFVYPFEGRSVHEGLASLLGYRLAALQPMSFSYAMNDYGFELLSDQEIPLFEALELDWFRLDNLEQDLEHSIQASEASRRKFREIAAISGMVFQGMPDKPVGIKHLQASSSLLYEVLKEYDPQNRLFIQAQQEVRENQLELGRMRAAMERIQTQQIQVIELKQYSPFSFPIMVDRLRERVSTESLEDRIQKLIRQNLA
jgi:ATP-dependent Lhr-like helicase